MAEKSNGEISNHEFERIIAGYADNELRKVLKKRNQYQKKAADFAIKEAIRRRLIYSEQDLFASEFKPEPTKFSIFPTIENDTVRTKYRKSVTRFLIIVGVIPMVLGGMKITDAQSIEGILLFMFGAAWSIASYQLMRSLNIKLVYFLFLLLLISTGYLVKTMVSLRSVYPMDLIVAVIAVGLVFYLIGFLKKLRD